MHRRVGILLLSSLFAALASCATATLTHFRDPAFATKSFTSVAVFFPTADLANRVAVESYLVQCLGARGVRAVEGSKIYPPTRAWDEQALKAAVAESKVEAVLSIGAASADSQQHSMPGYAYFNAGTGTVIYNGGASYSSHSASANVDLFEATSGKKAWSATVKGQGDGLALVMREMVRQTVQDLMAEALLLPTLPVTSESSAASPGAAW